MFRGTAWISVIVLVCLLQGGASAQDAATATVTGRILDGSTGRPIIGASVAPVEESATVARTDLDGKFTLTLPPGTYQLRLSAPLYEAKVLQNVVLTSGKTERISASLTPKVDTTVEIVEVVADVTASTEATQLLKRRMAPTVSDNLGAETIAKSPDSDAAEVVTRVPAVTIKDDKFVVVRGLNERYSAAVLNRSRLPSTDPNRRVVPLDLFPADFIESLSIIKSYTPDLPGDFAGGLVDIRLADPPPRLTYGLGISSAINTYTTFQSFDTYDGTTADWFGFGEDYRGLPQGFPSKEDFNDSVSSTTRAQATVGSLRNNWDIHSETAPPDFGVDATVGNTYGPFGFNLSGLYGYKYRFRSDEQINQVSPNFFESFTYDRSTFETKLGAILTTSYKLSPNHKFSGRSFVNRKSQDLVLVGDSQTGTESDQVPASTTDQQYVVDQLGFGQLEGQHHFSLADVDWRASWAPSYENQPDSKITLYQTSDEATGSALIFKSPSTSRQFATLNEFLQDYYVDLAFPFETWLPFTGVWSGLSAQFKTGLAYSLRDRDFTYRYLATDGNLSGTLDLTQPPDALLSPKNYGGPSIGPLIFTDSTLPTDDFNASQEIAAAYGMLELPIIRERLRFVGGVRVEYSYIQIDFGKQAIINDLDPLPGVSLIYTPREDMNVRAAFSQTVSRPEFRELSPVQFQVCPGCRAFQGNPNLISSSITSWDLRWEWFFSPLEFVSASFFYKELENPIEIVALPSASEILDFPINADHATAWGFEMEARKNFNFLVPYLRRWKPLKPIASAFGDVELTTNVAIIESDVSGLDDPDHPIANTNDPRPLQGQAPFVVNAALEYEHYEWGLFRLLYNTVGDTINAGGVDIQPDNPDTKGLDDIFQRRRDQLDFVWVVNIEPFGTPVQAKFAVENILNDDYIETEKNKGEEFITHKYRTGQTFTFGLSYKF